ncbi:unnamed protein product [Ixodes persulcatus]
MIASIIERHPQFIGKLYSFLAQFAPLPPSPNGTQPQPGNRQEEQPSRGDNRQSSETAHTQSGAATPSNTGRRPETQDGDTPVQDCGVPPREFERAQIGEINQNLARVPLTPSATMDADDTEWPVLSPGRKRRRGFETSGHSKQGELVQLALPPTQTVVLRSVGKKEVGAYTGKEIKEAIERAGIQTTDQYTIRRNEKANAISIMTKDPLCLDKLLKVRAVYVESAPVAAIQGPLRKSVRRNHLLERRGKRRRPRIARNGHLQQDQHRRGSQAPWTQRKHHFGNVRGQAPS